MVYLDENWKNCVPQCTSVPRYSLSQRIHDAIVFLYLDVPQTSVKLVTKNTGCYPLLMHLDQLRVPPCTLGPACHKECCCSRLAGPCALTRALAPRYLSENQPENLNKSNLGGKGRVVSGKKEISPQKILNTKAFIQGFPFPILSQYIYGNNLYSFKKVIASV